MPYRSPEPRGATSSSSSMPAITAASSEATAQYGLASAPGVRNSMRVERSPSTSERTAAVRLSAPQVAVAGAYDPASKRL